MYSWVPNLRHGTKKGKGGVFIMKLAKLSSKHKMGVPLKILLFAGYGVWLSGAGLRPLASVSGPEMRVFGVLDINLVIES